MISYNEKARITGNGTQNAAELYCLIQALFLLYEEDPKVRCEIALWLSLALKHNTPVENINDFLSDPKKYIPY